MVCNFNDTRNEIILLRNFIIMDFISIFHQDGVHFELNSYRVIKSKVTLSLSNSSLELKLEDTGESIYIPLHLITNYQLIQPIFGANYLSATWSGEGKFSLTFKEGGAAHCFEILTKLIADNVSQNAIKTQTKDINDKKMD